MLALNRARKVDSVTSCDDLGLVVLEQLKIADLIKLGNLSVKMKISSKTLLGQIEPKSKDSGKKKKYCRKERKASSRGRNGVQLKNLQAKKKWNY